MTGAGGKGRWPQLDYSSTPMSSATERAWAAGLFDGEGTSCPHRPRKSAIPTMRMHLSQKNTGPEILLRLQGALQVGQVKERSDRPGVWIWRCQTRQGCLFALKSMWPFLSTPKRDQASALMTPEEISYVSA